MEVSVSQGLENLDEILESSRQIIQALENTSLDDQRNALQGSEEQLAELKDKFFMNTVAAIPATKVCLTGSEKVLSALAAYRDDEGDASLAAVKKALDDLSEKVEELVDKAEMRGTTLT